MIAPDSSLRKSRLQRAFTVLGLGALLTAYCLHLSVISRYAVDIPELDEWGIFLTAPRHFKNGPTFDWLLRRHNEHHIALPRLESQLFYQFNRWDIASQQIFNFFLFGFLVALVVYAGKRLRPTVSLGAVSAFALFLLSPLGHRNHTWAIQSHVHYVLIFLILSALALFSARQRSWVLLLGLITLVLACCSQAAGIAASIPLIVLYLVFKLRRILEEPDSRTRIREVCQGLVILLASTGVFGFWFFHFFKNPRASTISVPFSVDFWRFLLDELSFTFGYKHIPVSLGIVFFLLVVIPLVGTVFRSRGRLSPSLVTLVSLMIAFLAILASIAIGRGNQQEYSVSGFHSKFFHFAVILLPFTFLAWHWFLEGSKKLRVVFCTGLWILAAVGFAYNLSFDAYRQTHQKRVALEQSVLRYYHGVGPLPTEPGMPKNRPVETYLANARKLGVSFALRLGLPDSRLQRGVWMDFARPSRMIGRCEGIEEDGVLRGWAVAPRHPYQKVSVFFTMGNSSDPERNERIGETTATLPRRDVNIALSVPGDHGFHFEIPPDLAGSNHFLRCWVVDPKDGSEHPLPGGDLLLPSAWPSHPVGFFNGVDAEGAVVGWALDPADPEKSLRVHFFLDGPSRAHGGTPLGFTTADRLRLDVQQITAHDGRHGFRFQLPEIARDGKKHRLFGFAKGTDEELFPLNHTGFEFSIP